MTDHYNSGAKLFTDEPEPEDTKINEVREYSKF